MTSATRFRLALLLALFSVAACDERAESKAHLPTAPNTQPQLSIVNGARVVESGSGTLRAGVRTGVLPAWSATATMSGGLAVEDRPASPLGALAIAQPNRLLLGDDAGVRYTSFIDDQHNQVDVAWIFSPDGGPARSVKMYVNGALRMATDYRWSASGGSYTIASATRRIYEAGVEKGSVTAAVSAVQLLAARTTPVDVLARFATRAGRLFVPRDLDAQLLSGPCRVEFLEYAAATALLAGAIAVWERNPANVALIAAVAAASARATIAEMRLWICQQNAAERAAAGGSGGGGALLSPITCLVDPYAPGCNGTPVERQ